MKDVINRYSNIDTIPITMQMIRQYRGAHASYTVNLASVQKAEQEEAARTEEKARAETEMEKAVKRKAQIEKKQSEGEQLVAEATQRLAKATMSTSDMNVKDILAARALLQTGSAMLTESRCELQEMESTSPHKILKKH